MQPAGVLRPSFPTVDDCFSMAQVLAERLKQLGEQKYPLDVRRGTHLSKPRKTESASPSPQSRQIKAGGRTYFLDIERSKVDDRRYLRITESRFDGKGKTRRRSSIIVFPESLNEFVGTLTEISDQIA